MSLRNETTSESVHAGRGRGEKRKDVLQVDCTLVGKLKKQHAKEDMEFQHMSLRLPIQTMQARGSSSPLVKAMLALALLPQAPQCPPDLLWMKSDRGSVFV